MFEDSMIIQNDLDDLDDLIEITSKIGNVLDSPGYGGNVSVKTLDGLYIKASGTAVVPAVDTATTAHDTAIVAEAIHMPHATFPITFIFITFLHKSISISIVSCPSFNAFPNSFSVVIMYSLLLLWAQIYSYINIP